MGTLRLSVARTDGRSLFSAKPQTALARWLPLYTNDARPARWTMCVPSGRNGTITDPSNDRTMDAQMVMKQQSNDVTTPAAAAAAAALTPMRPRCHSSSGGPRTRIPQTLSICRLHIFNATVRRVGKLSQFFSGILLRKVTATTDGCDNIVSCEFLSIRRTCDYNKLNACLLYTSPSPRDRQTTRMPSSA